MAYSRSEKAGREELKQELLEGGVFAAAQHGQRSFKQARELLRQKKTIRKFFGPKKFHGASGKGPGSQASTRGQPSALAPRVLSGTRMLGRPTQIQCV